MNSGPAKYINPGVIYLPSGFGIIIQSLFRIVFGLPYFVDSPMKALYPLRSGWGVGWKEVGGGEGKGVGGRKEACM